MGQQQLLLLVVGIVIVGLAVVVGIQAFGENQKKANADALVNDGVRIAADAQVWALKPQAFGGGDGDFEGVTFDHLGYGASGGVYENLTGRFSLTVAAPLELVIHACGNDAYRGGFNEVTVTVTSMGPNGIETVATSAEACTP